MRSRQEQTITRAHPPWMYALLLATVLGLLLLYWAFANPRDAKNAQPLLRGWSYRIGDDGDFSPVEVLNYYIPVEPGTTLTMKRVMTEAYENPALLIHLDFLRARVELSGEALFDNENDPAGYDKGISDRMIPLPDDYVGRELVVGVSSPYELYSFSPDTIWLGDERALEARLRGNAAGGIALMFVLALSGLTLMVFSLATGAEREGFLFGLACVLYGMWFPGQTAAYLSALPPQAAARLQYAMFHLYEVPMLWFLWMKCRKTRRAALVMSALYSVVAIGYMGAMALGHVAPPDTLFVMNPALILAALGMFCLCVLEWRRKNPFFQMTAPAFLALAAGGVLSVIDIQGFHTPKDVLHVAGLLMLVALVWSDTLRTYRLRRKQELEQRQLMLLKEHVASDQIASAEAHNKETHLLRHEIRHHLAVLAVLQREGKLKEIGGYLRELDAMERGLEPDQYCAHPLLNAILAKAAQDCAREGVEFGCEAQVPAGIMLADGDLSVLLMNMLENAVEAARRVTDADRWVRIQMRVKQGFLVIHCANARQGRIEQIGDRFASTKADARLHGYGILAMRQVVEKYDSRLNIDYDDGSFNVRTILRLPVSPEDG